MFKVFIVSSRIWTFIFIGTCFKVTTFTFLGKYIGLGLHEEIKNNSNVFAINRENTKCMRQEIKHKTTLV
jgi:hypothetical protein